MIHVNNFSAVDYVRNFEPKKKKCSAFQFFFRENHEIMSRRLQNQKSEQE